MKGIRMKRIGKGLCKNTGVNKEGLVYGELHHKVQLTEKDLYFLEKVLIDYTIQDQQEYNHKIDIIKLIEEMIQDY